MSGRLRVLLAAALVVLGACTASAAPKTDVVVLNNGDRLTVEIKTMSRGRLTVKTDALGTPNVDWGDVVGLQSSRSYEIEVTDGRRYYGSLIEGVRNHVLVRGLIGTPTDLVLLDIIRLTPLGASFWSRLDGNLDAGFNFTSASEQTQWTLNTSVEYRKKAFLNRASLSSQLTKLEASSQTRNNLNLSTQRFLKNRWFTGGVGQFLQDESLDLDFRSVLGAIVGRYLTQTNHTTVSLFSGGGYTLEHFTGSTAESSFEVLFGGDWEWFSPASSSIDFSSTAISYYNVGTRPRARIEFSTSLKRELFKDFYWNVSGFDSYDSSPPQETQKKNDFGITLSVGYSF
jgi:uncharacterized protein DUF481